MVKGGTTGSSARNPFWSTVGEHRAAPRAGDVRAVGGTGESRALKGEGERGGRAKGGGGEPSFSGFQRHEVLRYFHRICNRRAG